MATAVPASAEASTSVKIAPPDSAQEREADRIADRVMSGAAVGGGGLAGRADTIHRQCAACNAGGMPCEDCGGEDEGTMLHRMPSGPARGQGASLAASAVASGGRPLPNATRAYFEPRFGTDLGHVRMHDNARAGTAAKAINARAFAYGSNIAFAPGEFAPGTEAGQRLIAHELAHVVKSSPSNAVQRDLFDDAHMRSLSQSELETLTTSDLEILLNDIRAAIQPESSPENDGLISNMEAVEGILIDRYNTESSEHAAPGQRRRRTASVSEPAEHDEVDVFSTAGASAVQSGLRLGHADQLTVWNGDDAGRQEFHREYLEYAREHDPDLYDNAREYLLWLSEYRERQKEIAENERVEAELAQRANEQYRRDMYILQNNRLGFWHMVLPSHTRHTRRNRCHEIHNHYLRSICRTNEEGSFAAARFNRDLLAVTAGVAGAALLLSTAGLVALELGAGAAVASATTATINFVGGELALAGGALKMASTSAWGFYLSNAIAVNEIGLFAVGTIISVEGDVAGLLEAMANDPLAAAQILMEVWVLKVNIQVANGPARPYTVRARAEPARRQNNPGALRLRVVSDPVPDDGPAPVRTGRTAHAEGVGDDFALDVRPQQPAPQQVRRRGGGVSAPEAPDTQTPQPARTRSSSQEIQESFDEHSQGTARASRTTVPEDEVEIAPQRGRGRSAAGSPDTLSRRIEWRPPEGAPPPPPESAPLATRQRWLRSRLQMHVDAAIERYHTEGLTPGQASAAQRRPQMTPTFRGSRIDQFAKDSIQQDPHLARVITAPDFVSEPDLLHAGMPQWFDITTRRQWGAHLERYGARYGTDAVLLPTDGSQE